MHVVVETERMLLRHVRSDDVDALVELDADPEVMRFVTGGRATPRAEVERDVLPALLAYHDRHPGYGFLMAVDRATGEVLGWFHLRARAGDPVDEPELGYRLRRDAWGRGLATEGARALVAAAFERWGARRVTAETMAVNQASRRVMEKAGLRYVRTFHAEWPDRIPGDELGDVEYAVTRAEWFARERPGP
ncbi:GNAT family N-acetyltransferase [Thalassiella azotivora]